MRLGHWSRALPTLVVAALLCLAAASPRSSRLGPAPPALMVGPCDSYAFVTGGDSTYAFGSGGGVSQPLAAGEVVLACSLHVQASGWSNLQVDLRSWDPTTLAPDPNTVALRTAFLDPSDLNYYTENRMHQTLPVPPAITRSMPGVAEAPRETSALEVTGAGGSFLGYFDPAGVSSEPAARAVAALGARPPLPGTHPVLAQGLCAGEASLQELRVAQSVSRTDDTLSWKDFQILQRFRVPAAVRLHWLELAVALQSSNEFGWNAATVEILDAGATPVPGTTLPSPLVQAQFPNTGVRGPTWVSDVGFDHTLVLEPGHDYFVLVDRGTATFPPGFWSGLNFYTRTLTGNENPSFQYGVRELYTRASATGEWTQVANRALSFKLIGLLATPESAPPVARNAFRLTVAPNPTRGAAEVAWSGATGPVKLEVLDARGRRVASGVGGAAGRWHWNSADRGGQWLPAGVYLVHARDTAGGHAVQRVVVVR